MGPLARPCRSGDRGSRYAGAKPFPTSSASDAVSMLFDGRLRWRARLQYCLTLVSPNKWEKGVVRCSTHSTFVSRATWIPSNKGPRGDRGSGPILAITRIRSL